MYMKKFQKILVMVLLCTLFGLLFSACGNTGEKAPANKGANTVDSPESPSSTASFSWATWCLSEESLEPTYDAMAKTFISKNPNVQIEYVTYPYANYKDQLIISAAAENSPDISHIKAEWLPELIDVGSLMDLTGVLSDKLKEDYFPSFLEGVTVDGKILAAPWFNNPMAMFYNKTLLTKAGIQELPKNWDELMDAAYKISALGADENGNKIYGYAIPITKAEPAFGYNFFSHMWAWGGEFMNEKGEIVINTPENVAAFDELRQLIKDEITPNGATCKDIRNLFAQGVIGFYYDLQMCTGVFAQASPKGEAFAEEYGAMVIPEKNGPNGFAYTTEHHLAVAKTATETEMIGKFIDHMTGKEVIQLLYDAGMGKMPDRKSVAELEIFSNPADEITKAFVAALDTVRTLPTRDAAFSLADEAFADAMAKLSISNDSTEKIVADLEETVKELYGQK
jgi:multiple sugar transport system substrate-binding protein